MALQEEGASADAGGTAPNVDGAVAYLVESFGASKSRHYRLERGMGLAGG